MLRSLLDIKHYKTQAIDGNIGTVRDILFDDCAWTVRYFVVDTGSWFPARKVLISPVAVGRANWDSQELRVMLTRDQIRDAPGIETDKPVSRQEEERLAEYYAWPSYWTMPNPIAAPPEAQRNAAEQARKARARAQSEGDPHLRSVREVTGYKIEAKDGSIGHVEDFIGDDDNWMIRYMNVDTRDWLPGKNVLVSPASLEEVDWPHAKVHVDLKKEQIEAAPEYDPSKPISSEYEKRLYETYGRPAFWAGFPQY